MAKKTIPPVESEPVVDKIMLGATIGTVMGRLLIVLEPYNIAPLGGQYPDSRCIRVYLPDDEQVDITLTAEPNDKTGLVLTSNDPDSDVQATLRAHLEGLYA